MLRVFASGVACALVLLQGAGIVHSFLDSHEICREHGELVHGHRGREMVAADSPAPAGFGALRSSRAATPDPEHEHCQVSFHQRARAVPKPASSVVTPLEREVNTAAQARDVLPPHIPLLAIAPKSSPPIG
jgi:hypothetical protein